MEVVASLPMVSAICSVRAHVAQRKRSKTARAKRVARLHLLSFVDFHLLFAPRTCPNVVILDLFCLVSS